LGIKLKANVLHHDFNPCGGAERVSFATMKAITEMGIDFDITTYTEPDLHRIVSAYRKDQASMINCAKKLNVITSFQNPSIKNNLREVPFYQDHTLQGDTITYSHFPMARQYIESKNVECIRRDLRIQDYDWLYLTYLTLGFFQGSF
jgi:hypothetical protein